MSGDRWWHSSAGKQRTNNALSVTEIAINEASSVISELNELKRPMARLLLNGQPERAMTSTANKVRIVLFCGVREIRPFVVKRKCSTEGGWLYEMVSTAR
jgi:hypothetical protein